MKVFLSRRRLNKTVRKIFNWNVALSNRSLLTWLSSLLQQQCPQFFSRITVFGFEGSSWLKNWAFLPSQLCWFWWLLALIAGGRSCKISESIFIVPSIEASVLISFWLKKIASAEKSRKSSFFAERVRLPCFQDFEMFDFLFKKILRYFET